MFSEAVEAARDQWLEVIVTDFQTRVLMYPSAKQLLLKCSSRYAHVQRYIAKVVKTDCSSSTSNPLQIVWQWTFGRDKVEVDSQSDKPTALTQEKIKNRSVLRQISTTESWLGITFLSFFLSPSCPLIQHFLTFAVYHVCESKSTETGSQEPTSHNFSQTGTHKLPAECRKVQLSCKPAH